MYKDKKVYLCAFHNLDLYPSAIRFKKQAESFNIFDEIFIYHEYNLPYDKKFESLLRPKLSSSRGFGYWCWKPFVILNILESMDDDDILFYADIGCHFNKESINIFYEYLDIVIEKGALCFKTSYPEKMWTKSDLFNYFNVLDDTNIIDTHQLAATCFFLLKNTSNIELIKKWLQIYYDDFSLIDDTPSKIPNADIFIENRHDQSAFSVLAKIYSFPTYPFNQEKSKNKKIPINALRDKKNVNDIISLNELTVFMDMYLYKFSNQFHIFVDRLVWFIPIRNKRDDFRYNINLYAMKLIKKYFDVNEIENINIVNIKIIDRYLKYIINKKVQRYIKTNINEIKDYVNFSKNSIEEAINYISKYK
ncbi:hypothetical protein [Brachyspira alvinipulli]|uniref:hypothetical protein n=1 Tax=Brachyspira alvinipulli TaxID=84379 RepID=UPI0004815914|nr:hypothetical protein [Brachyspira alvinipulli]